MASIAGATAVLIKWFSYSLSLAILPLVLIVFTLFTAYLAQVEIVSADDGKRKQAQKRLTVLLTSLTYKRRLLEVVLDLLVISSAYYFAFALRYEFRLNEYLLALFLNSLPIVVAASYVAFFFFGIYRGLWRYTGLEDLVRIAQAVACATLLSMAALIFVYRFVGYSRMVFIVYGLLLFFGVAGSRLSFRLFGLYLRGRRQEKIPVLVYGAGDGGEIVVRECRNNSHVGYRPIGFVDDDPRKAGTHRTGTAHFWRGGQAAGNYPTGKSGGLHYFFSDHLGERARRTDSHCLPGTGIMDQATAAGFRRGGALINHDRKFTVKSGRRWFRVRGSSIGDGF